MKCADLNIRASEAVEESLDRLSEMSIGYWHPGKARGFSLWQLPLLHGPRRS
jgi:hypothetical protein